ncbi:MAG: rRNA maturation RNase YbeY [Spirochaetes bacterium]|nr:rRNA maturation RNase YbeY [Spirochaetota bacterium]
MKNTVYINGEFETLNINSDSIIKYVQQILVKLELNKKELSIYFCGNDEMRTYNKKYRDINNNTTDVLSFLQQDTDDRGFDKNILGDVVICTDVLIKQAGEYKVSLKSELFRLLIHGILHLLGYEHETNLEDEKIMQKKEQSLMEYLGVKFDK